MHNYGQEQAIAEQQKYYAAQGAAGNGLGVASANNSGIETAPTGLDAFCNRLADTMKALEYTVQGMEEVEAKLNGAHPEKSASTAPRPVPNGTLNLMDMAIEELNSRIGRLNATMIRLKRSI